MRINTSTFNGFLFFLLLSINVLGQTTYSHISGTLQNKQEVFDAAYLSQLNTRLTDLESNTDYSIYIEINEEIPRQRKYKEMTPENLQLYKSERMVDNLKRFKKLKSGAPALIKGVVLHLDFIKYPAPGGNGETVVFYMQTISLSPTLSSFAKTSLTTLTQNQKLELGSANYTTNQTQLDQLVNSIITIFDKDKTQPQDNYQFGPLVIKIPTSTLVKGQTKVVNGVTLEKFTTTDASFVLPVLGSGFQRLDATVNPCTINYFYDQATGYYSDVEIKNTPATPGLYAGKLILFDVFVKNIDVKISSTGNLTGSLGLRSDLDRDVQYQLFVVRKGFGGDYTFTYAGANNFNGSYNFSGLSGFQLDALKEQQTIASLKGSISAAGIISGTLQTTQPVEIKGTAFTTRIDNFLADVDYSLKDGVKVKSGQLLATFTNLPGMSGDLKISGTYNATGQLTANIDKTGSKVSVFGMQLQQIGLGIVLDAQLTPQTITGNFSAKHADFDAALTVSAFEWGIGTGVKTFSGYGAVAYKGFQFEISDASYTAGNLVCSASAMVNLGSGNAKLAVTDFSISNTGTISVGGIEGNITKYPFDVQFAAEFGQGRFSGYFKGDMVSIGIEGTIDVGQAGTGNSRYTFCYLKLVASGPGVPIPAFPVVKITSLGGEFGYNYNLQFPHQSGAQPGTPQYNSYIAGFTVGLADVANLVNVSGNPVIQATSSTLDLAMTAQMDIPRYNPWFSQNVNIHYKAPDQVLSGSMNYEFSLPKGSTPGNAIIYTQNLGMDFLFDKTEWYVGRKSMEAKLFSAVTLTGGAEFSGNYTSPSTYSAAINGALDFDYNWNGSKSMDVLGYGMSVSASIALKMHAGANLAVNDKGISGNVNASMSADGTISLDLCTTCSSSWTKYDIAVKSNISGQLTFVNTRIDLAGHADVRATVCGNTGTFQFDLAYSFDPTKNGSGSFTSSSTTTVSKTPTQQPPLNINNLPKPGSANTYFAQFNQKKNNVNNNNSNNTAGTGNTASTKQDSIHSIIENYKQVNLFLNQISSSLTLPRPEFEEHLVESGFYVLTKFNTLPSYYLLNYSKLIAQDPDKASEFAASDSDFDKWLLTNPLPTPTFITNDSRDHILKGQIKISVLRNKVVESEYIRTPEQAPFPVPAKGVNILVNIVGFHTHDAVAYKDVTIMNRYSSLQKLPNGEIIESVKFKVFVQEANNGKGGDIVKSNNSTLWPQGWQETQIFQKISEAYVTRQSLGGNKYKGITSEGFYVEMYIDNTDGHITTAYPLVQF